MINFPLEFLQEKCFKITKIAKIEGGGGQKAFFWTDSLEFLFPCKQLRTFYKRQIIYIPFVDLFYRVHTKKRDKIVFFSNKNARVILFLI